MSSFVILKNGIMGVMFELENFIYLLNWVPSQRARPSTGVSLNLRGCEMINVRRKEEKQSISQASFSCFYSFRLCEEMLGIFGSKAKKTQHWWCSLSPVLLKNTYIQTKMSMSIFLF